MDANELAIGNKLMETRVNKEYEILERLCTFIFSVANFYYEGYQKMSKLEPDVRELMNVLVSSKNDYLEGKNQFDVDAVCI